MLKSLGSGGSIKVGVAVAEVTVQEHGLNWWLERGVKCPDCDEIKFLIILSQSRMGISRCASELWDAQHTANFVCGDFVNGIEVTKTLGCGCKFRADFIEKESYHHKPLYKRME